MITLGSLLADLSQHRPTQRFLASHQRLFSFVVAPSLLLVGLLLGSYPQEHPDWAPWSLWMHETFVAPADGGGFLVPQGTDAPRRFSAAGVQLCVLALFVSPVLREALSHRVLLWLGHHSFAVYLTHGTILRTVGIWIAYGIRPRFEAHRDGTYDEYMHIKSREAVLGAVVVFVLLSYSVAWAWMRWVDSACARATQWLEAQVFQCEVDDDDDEADSPEQAYRRGSLSQRLLPTIYEEKHDGSGGSDWNKEVIRHHVVDLGYHYDHRLLD